MSDRTLGPYIAASVALIAASVLLTVWLVLLYRGMEDIQRHLDQIDTQIQAPEPTAQSGRAG